MLTCKRDPMKSYNGFPPEQRNKAQAWLNSQWKAGLLARPCRCHACGQTGGRIDAHAEDYSEPFQAGKTDQYHLCYRCHMAVHCRFRNKEAWEIYKQQVRNGQTFEAIYNNFPLFIRQFADLRGKDVSFTQGSPLERTVLDEIG